MYTYFVHKRSYIRVGSKAKKLVGVHCVGVVHPIACLALKEVVKIIESTEQPLA